MKRHVVRVGCALLIGFLGSPGVAHAGDALGFTPQVPVAIKLGSGGGFGGATIDSVLKEDYQLGGHQIKGVLMSPQAQKPAADEKLVLVAWCVAVEAAGALGSEAACRDKSTWEGIAKVRMEAQTGKAGEFAFKEVPAGQFAIFALRSATGGLPGRTTAGRPVGLPILREQGQHAIARFVMSDGGQPSNITMWIVQLP